MNYKYRTSRLPPCVFNEQIESRKQFLIDRDIVRRGARMEDMVCRKIMDILGEHPKTFVEANFIGTMAPECYVVDNDKWFGRIVYDNLDVAYAMYDASKSYRDPNFYIGSKINKYKAEGKEILWKHYFRKAGTRIMPLDPYTIEELIDEIMYGRHKKSHILAVVMMSWDGQYYDVIQKMSDRYPMLSIIHPCTIGRGNGHQIPIHTYGKLFTNLEEMLTKELNDFWPTYGSFHQRASKINLNSVQRDINSKFEQAMKTLSPFSWKNKIIADITDESFHDNPTKLILGKQIKMKGHTRYSRYNKWGRNAYDQLDALRKYGDHMPDKCRRPIKATMAQLVPLAQEIPLLAQHNVEIPISKEIDLFYDHRRSKYKVEKVSMLGSSTTILRCDTNVSNLNIHLGNRDHINVIQTLQDEIETCLSTIEGVMKPETDKCTDLKEKLSNLMAPFEIAIALKR